MNALRATIVQGLKLGLLVCGSGASLLVAACGAPAAPSAAPASSVQAAPELQVEEPRAAVKVVFLGDSLTAGYGLAPDEALPQQIQAIWEAGGVGAVAINAGVSGDTTANGLARFEWSVTAAQPDLVVIALGANDFLMGVPAEIARANLETMLDRAKAAGIPAILVGIAPRGGADPGTREAAFAAVYPGLAEKYGVPYFPSLLEEIAGQPSLLQSDGLHPTREGVARMAAPLAQFLEPELEFRAPHTE